MTLELAYTWTITFLSLLLTAQSIELILVRKTFSENGIWKLSILMRDFQIFSRPTRAVLEYLLSYKVFCILLFVRFILGGLILFFPYSPLFLGLFLISVLINLRFRGTYNGGSDYITILTLLSLTVGTCPLASISLQKGCLIYIALNSILSYFIAGVIKIKNKGWRQGTALTGFSKIKTYQVPAFLQDILSIPKLALILSWTIMLLEFFFPLALLNPTVCLGFLIGVFLFHLFNVFTFGLNRFFWAWLTTYPSILFLATLLHTKT